MMLTAIPRCMPHARRPRCWQDAERMATAARVQRTACCLSPCDASAAFQQGELGYGPHLMDFVVADVHFVRHGGSVCGGGGAGCPATGGGG